MASRSLGVLSLNLVAKTKGFQEGMDKAGRASDQWKQKVERNARAVSNAIAVSTAAAAAGLVAMTKSALDSADEMSKTAQKLGIMTEQVAGLQLAYEMSGLSAEDMKTSIAKLADQAARGNTAFDKLGVSVKNSDGSLRDTRELLAKVSDKFAAMEDSTEKTALAMQLFGRTGADLLPMLNGGAAALAEMDAEARRLGLTIDSDTARAAEAFNDQVSLLQKEVTGLGRQVMTALMPSLTKGVNTVSAFVGNLHDMDGALKAIKTALIAGASLMAGRYVGAMVKSKATVALLKSAKDAYAAATSIATSKNMAFAASLVAVQTKANMAKGAVAALKATVTALGGPAGILAAAATAVYMFSKAQDDARTKTINLRTEIDRLSAAIATMSAAQAAAELVKMEQVRIQAEHRAKQSEVAFKTIGASGQHSGEISFKLYNDEGELETFKHSVEDAQAITRAAMQADAQQLKATEDTIRRLKEVKRSGRSEIKSIIEQGSKTANAASQQLAKLEDDYKRAALSQRDYAIQNFKAIEGVTDAQIRQFQALYDVTENLTKAKERQATVEQAAFEASLVGLSSIEQARKRAQAEGLEGKQLEQYIEYVKTIENAKNIQKASAGTAKKNAAAMREQKEAIRALNDLLGHYASLNKELMTDDERRNATLKERIALLDEMQKLLNDPQRRKAAGITDNMVPALQNEINKNRARAMSDAMATNVREIEKSGFDAAIHQISENVGTLNDVLENGTVSAFDSAANALANFAATGKLNIRELAVSVLQDLSRMLMKFAVMKAAMSMFGGAASFSGIGLASNGYAGMSMLPTYANGGAFSDGLQFFAKGGVVDRPTAFGMAGGKTGIMGEAGEEAIMPLARGRDGKLGVTFNGKGGGSQEITINQTTIINADGSSESDADGAQQVAGMIKMIVADTLQTEMRPGGRLNNAIKKIK